MNICKTDLDQLTPEVVSLASKAGDLICEIYKKDVEVIEKKDGSPVTQADHKSHFFLKQGLEQLTPSIPVISEEDEASWKIKNPLYWLIDPLDGTKGFISKTGEFCINIALIKENDPIFGLIHIPLTHEAFYGYQGKAWHHIKGKTLPIHTRHCPPKGMTLLLGGFGQKYQKQEALFLKSYPIAKIKRIRSAIKFCTIASGQADLYVRFETCSEWDTAAGQILVEAAGGAMRNLDGSPLVYGKPNFRNEGFVVFGSKP